ncbi:MAG: hypothetical protein LBS00_12040, partial [Synergistaceae bacterium]|nr:hypothetical protein [Synergistaceae bacterium]
MSKRQILSRSSAKSRIFVYILLGLLGIVVVGAGIVSTVDIAGDAVAGLAAKTVKEKTGMILTVRRTRGNPVRGYTFDDMALASAPEASGTGENRLFAAQTLTARVNFMSLLRGSPRLSLLAIGGVDMDMDRLVQEISKIEFGGSSSGGEVPIDCVRLQNSRFTSKWGAIDVNDADVVIEGSLMSAIFAGAVNDVPVKGVLDADVRGSAASVNRMEFRVGEGLLTAAGSVKPTHDAGGTTSGGTTPGGTTALDFQGSIKGLNVSEITSFWPAFLSSDDYAGNADVDFTIEGAGSNLLIAAALNFKGSLLGGYPLSELSAQLRYADMRLSAENVKATALSVPIEGSAAMAMRTGETPSIMIKLHGGNAPLAELAKAYPVLGKVDGTVEKFTVNVQGPTNALSGTIELSAPRVVLMNKRIENFAVQV